MSELIPINTKDLQPLEVFKTEKVDEILSKIKDEAKKFTQEFGTDVSKKTARDEIISFAFKITRSKTALDELGKDLVSEWKQKSAAVDKERKRIRDTLDELAKEVRKPVTEWEEEEARKALQEEKRVQEHNDALERLQEIGRYAAEAPQVVTVELLNEGLRTSQEFFETRDWQEFGPAAAQQACVNAKAFERAIEARIQYQNDQAELEDLRRKQRERDAEQEAIDTARQQIALIQSVGERLHDMSKNQIGAMIEDLEAPDRKEYPGDLQKLYEQAIILALSALKSRYKELEDKEREDIAAAERKKIEDEQAAEQKRKDDEAEQNRLAEEKRAANKRHQAKINTESLQDIKAILEANMFADGEADLNLTGKKIVEAIAQGKIRHVSIKY